MKIEEVILPDKGSIKLEWTDVNSKYLDNENTRVLFVIHGLTGGSDCNYIKNAALEGYLHGYRVCCINMRGFNNKLTTNQVNDWSSTKDLDYII